MPRAQDTREALELQIASEKRERYTAYATIAATAEYSDGQPGFTADEWNDFAARVTRLQGNIIV